MTPASQTDSTSLSAEKMALLRDLVRDLLKISPNGKAQEVAIRDEQGTLLAHVVPAALPCLFEVDLGDLPPSTEEKDIPVEDLLTNWGEV